jgi:hypothetical protein
VGHPATADSSLVPAALRARLPSVRSDDLEGCYSAWLMPGNFQRSDGICHGKLLAAFAENTRGRATPSGAKKRHLLVGRRLFSFAIRQNIGVNLSPTTATMGLLSSLQPLLLLGVALFQLLSLLLMPLFDLLSLRL